MIAACSQLTQLSRSQYTPGVNGGSWGGNSSPTYNLLYEFRGKPSDGTRPITSLILVSGNAYGTTFLGGTNNVGTIYELLSGSRDNVLHSFTGGSGYDGAFPYASLIDVSGTLYGTTYEGGQHNRGTFFSISPNGTNYKKLYDFGKGATDGVIPEAGLINVSGTLYGTTLEGGVYGFGTIFSITTSGAEKVLHSFGYGKDGAFDGSVSSGLTNVNGTLYGTTTNGGEYNWGTFYRISPYGTNYNKLFDFGKNLDGKVPFAALIDVKGTLYGTTFKGGSECPKIEGCGTVFSITTKGAENVLHSFAGGADDGAHPEAGLTYMGGTLYGTTVGGGRYDSVGTIFRITTSGTMEKVLHSFGDGTDGSNPEAGMITDVVSHVGILVGTTSAGGAYGKGTVFYLIP